MKVLLILILVAVMYGMPVLMYQTTVQPQLDSLKQTYSNAESIAQQAAGL
jgi:hypothetical protein